MFEFFDSKFHGSSYFFKKIIQTRTLEKVYITFQIMDYFTLELSKPIK